MPNLLKQFLTTLAAVLLLSCTAILIVVMVLNTPNDPSVLRETTPYVVYSNLIIGVTVLLLFLLVAYIICRGLYHYRFIIGANWKSRIFALGIVSLLSFQSIHSLVFYPIRTVVYNSYELISVNLFGEALTNDSYIIRNTYPTGVGVLQSAKEIISDSRSNYTVGYNDGYTDGYDDAYDDARILGVTQLDSSNSKRLTNSIEPRRGDDWPTIMSNLGTLVMKWTSATFKALDRMLSSIFTFDNIKDGLLGLFLLFVVSYAFDLFTVIDEGKPARDWLKKERLNLVFVIIFVAGSFLSISSIIAIPELKNGKNIERISEVQFRRMLDSARLTYPDIKGAVQFTHYDFPFQQSIESIEKTELRMKDAEIDRRKKIKVDQRPYQGGDLSDPELSAIKTTIHNLNYYKQKLLTYQSAIARDSVRLIGMRNKVKENIDQTVADMTNQYKANLLRIAVGNERRELFIKLSKNFLNFLKTYRSFLTYQVATYDAKYEWIPIKLGELNNHLKTIDKLTEEGLVELTLYREYVYMPDIDEPIKDFNMFDDIQYGGTEEDKNLFATLSEWLLEARSPEMVLIAGMLGFGLLGAGISSLIRNRNLTDEAEMFEKSIASIIIGGVSASLVIFLSAKGGLAIFSNSEIDLNPYTLLFLCLVGSVFSEIVWEKAYYYIKSRSTAGKEGD